MFEKKGGGNMDCGNMDCYDYIHLTEEKGRYKTNLLVTKLVLIFASVLLLIFLCLKDWFFALAFAYLFVRVAYDYRKTRFKLTCLMKLGVS